MGKMAFVNISAKIIGLINKIRVGLPDIPLTRLRMSQLLGVCFALGFLENGVFGYRFRSDVIIRCRLTPPVSPE